MNFQNFAIAIDPKVEKMDHEVFSRYQEKILSVIKDDYFSEYYDATLKICYVTVVSDSCVIFQVNAIEQSFISDKQETCPEKASFFILNFSVVLHGADIIKFHDVYSRKNTLWDNLVDSFQKEYEKIFTDSEDGEDEDGNEPIIAFYDYEIYYRLVIRPEINVAIFMVEHMMLFVDPEDDLRNFKAPSRSSCIIFKIERDPTGQVWFIPSIDTVDLSLKLELV